ncbi:Rpn family recombination-promoting nuclease/putative transposase [Dyadobacter sp. CY356]|uniref:Rpn family recombination-promoting nuclease/putative transposase n=1 Tax=Dyadobacter sp. CY356 TaxID=2906442 RepID=UPI001F28320B|nr:Rpn family recombination-promoting nuclease/putative transposase [Dyadobacter sp. CY356]MCF0056235.1 Rpn family recombination-promoting nuclease/putative transposase [Dyadobacter sp. CY356]
MQQDYPTPGRFIDPLTDFGFKRLFGSEPNKEILIDFLNQLFLGQKVIRDLTYNQTELYGNNEDSKRAIFDLLCTGDNGEQFLVEMQRGRQDFFKERAIFYTSRLISEQLPKGNKWGYKLKEVYFIALLEFTLEESTSEQYLHDLCLIDKVTGKIFYDKLEYKFIELPKFTKTENELFTDLDRWLFLLKNIVKMDKMPLFMRKSVFEKVFKIAELNNLNKEERMSYDSSLKAKWDYENVMDYAIKTAVKTADEKAREDIVKNLLLNTDFSISKIAMLAGVTEQFVSDIRQELK